MRHVLDEQGFLLVRGFRQFAGMYQLLVTAQGLFVHLPDFVHVIVECLLHGGKTILQTSHDVVDWTSWYLLVVVSFGNAL